MGKKKREHIVFDQMRKVRKSIPFSKINSESKKKEKREEHQKNGSNDLLFRRFSRQR